MVSTRPKLFGGPEKGPVVTKPSDRSWKRRLHQEGSPCLSADETLEDGTPVTLLSLDTQTMSQLLLPPGPGLGTRAPGRPSGEQRGGFWGQSLFEPRGSQRECVSGWFSSGPPGGKLEVDSRLPERGRVPQTKESQDPPSSPLLLQAHMSVPREGWMMACAFERVCSARMASATPTADTRRGPSRGRACGLGSFF